jgi:hypothetical protein
MASRPEDLRERTKKFALRIIRLFRALPRGGDAQVIGKQLLRSGTSVAALSCRMPRKITARVCSKGWNRNGRGGRDGVLAGTNQRIGNPPDTAGGASA